jgi:hypothetical protein
VISSSHQKSGTINYHQKSNATPTTFAGTQNNVSNIESPNQPINQPRKISVLSVHSNLGPNHDNSQFLNPEDPRSQYKPVVDYKYSSSNLSTNPLSNLTHFANPSSQRSRSNSLTNSSGALHQDLRPQIVKVVSRANQNNPTPPISGQIYRPVSSYDSQTAQMMPN